MLKNFISKIQNSDETTKKMWLIILSGATMAIVIGFWVVYMDFTVAKIGAPANAPKLAQEAAQNERASPNSIGREKIGGGPGFFAIFSAGVKIIYDEIKEKFFSKNSIVIENQERNFVSENIEPIPKTKLK